MDHILLIEDSPESVHVIKRALEPEHCVTASATLSCARAQLQKGAYDLILLDVSLPDGDGFEFLADLNQSQANHQCPVFFLTSKAGLADQVLGYSLGADDYIIKPVQPVLLQAKVNAKLKKRAGSANDAAFSVFGDITLDIARHRVSVAGKPVDLTSLEFRLLTHFIRHREQVFSRDRLMTAVWGENTHILDRTIDTHISHLRTKLSSAQCVLEAVHGSGYRLVLTTY